MTTTTTTNNNGNEILTVLWIMNHKPTPEQKSDLGLRFCEGQEELEIVEMPEELAKHFANVDPYADSVADLANYIAGAMPKGRGQKHIVVIQGEPVLQTILVQIYQRCGTDCFAATTERLSSERAMPDGTVQKVSTFKHGIFRKYPDISGR